ncbi:MAG: hypothetical protein PHU42_01365 [Patescibacteria group bacterium]|nr:hypothetical protein [Patescibacteria group bacterium]
MPEEKDKIKNVRSAVYAFMKILFPLIFIFLIALLIATYFFEYDVRYDWSKRDFPIQNNLAK